MKILSRLSPDHRALFWQIARYGLTGLFVTGCQAGIYWTLAAIVDIHIQWANLCGYLAAVCIGYVSHSAFTFRGHGARDHQMARGVRFVAVSLLSYALNAFWVWWFITHMGWPEWSPIPAMIFVTPVMVFGLNRQWVFR